MNEPTGVAADAATILFNLLRSKYRWYFEEVACDRLSFFESTPQLPRRARSTSRLRILLVDGSSRFVAKFLP
ncbi:hypothetical protein [Arthrobacter sp. B6]|uniref:hypothetical protein n=1 Tax=Arthrobacter sp. B6 TaxID=1570137 RepID=UPI000832306D|nr:hypothetical protein [Arthrobacter sp. B6]